MSGHDEHMTDRDRLAWLNGSSSFWEGNPSLVVWEGIHLHCAGCGRSFGPAATWAASPDWEPGPLPDWPYPEDQCPVCELRATVDQLSNEMREMVPRPEPERTPLDPKRLP